MLTNVQSDGAVAKIHPVGALDATEEKLLEACLPDLAKNVAAGVKFGTLFALFPFQ